MTSLFPPLAPDTRSILDRLPGIIDKAFPVPGRFRSTLPRDVADLSRLLTAERQDRSVSYLGKPNLLQAYLRYFLPWNIYRLCRLLPVLPLSLKGGDAINDLGCGPLTFAAALWISRKELRTVPLEFRCVDRTPAVLEAGRKLFAALSAETAKPSGLAAAEADGSGGASCPWIIKTIRGEIKKSGFLSVHIKGKPAALTTAVNVYNELYWNFSPFDFEGILAFAEKSAGALSSLTDPSGSVFVMEPGIPRSGQFVALLRQSLMDESRFPLSPCLHNKPCPMLLSSTNENGRRGTHFKGGKGKWCHFAFDTEDAPSVLQRLSAAAGIPKERAVLSFVFSGASGQLSPTDGKKAENRKALKVRVISDEFPAGDFWGRYGCSERGLVLARGGRRRLADFPSGAAGEFALLENVRDGKSGALVTEV